MPTNIFKNPAVNFQSISWFHAMSHYYCGHGEKTWCLMPGRGVGGDNCGPVIKTRNGRQWAGPGYKPLGLMSVSPSANGR